MSVKSLFLSGANTYTGGTIINAGTLTLGASERLANNGALTITAGTFDMSSYSETVGTVAMTTGAISGSGTLTGTAFNLDSGTVNVKLAGSTGLTKNGTGTLILNNTNTYTGITTINAGTLQGSALSVPGNVVNQGILRFSQSSTGTYAGIISGSGALEKDGAGILTLTGVNTYASSTTISAGTLRQSVAGALPSGTALSLAGGGIDLNSFDLAVSSLTGTGNVALGSGNLIVNNASNNSYTGSISGVNGKLTKNGAGSLTLGAANSYSGGTTIGNGILIGSVTNSLQGNIVNNSIVRFAASHTYAGNMSGTGAVEITSGDAVFTGTNSYSGGTTITNATLTANAASFSGPVTLNSGSLTFNQVSNGLYAGSMGGSGNVTKSGAGELTLSGASTFTGNFYHQQGGLALGNDTALGTAQVAISSGVSVRADGGSRVITNPVVMSSSVTFTGNQDLTFTNVAAINLATGQSLSSSNSGKTTFNGLFEGAAGSTLSVSNGTFAIGDPNSFIGFRSAGTLQVANGATLVLQSAGFADVSPLTTLSGGMIAATNGISIGPSENLIGNGTVNAKIAAQIGSVFSATTGNLTLGLATHPSGFLTAGEIYTGANTVTLKDRNQAVLGSYTLLGSGGNSGTLTAVNGLIVDLGNNLEGQGTINSTNTLAKAVIMNGNTNGTGSGLVFNGYVKGIGTFDGTVVFNGTYAPGLSPVSTTLNNMTLGSSSILQMELGGTQLGSQYDHLDYTGTGTLDGTLDVVLINGFQPTLGDAFNLFDGNTTGSFTTVNLPTLGSGLTWDMSQLYSTGSLTVTAIPEPGTFALLGLSLAGLTLYARKRRQAFGLE